MVMEEVFILTRDVNGKRNYHYLRWDDVCNYIENSMGIRDEEILIVMVNDICIFSGLQHNGILNWDTVAGFFA